MPAATVCWMTVDWALPSDCSVAKTRRASTPQVPIVLIRWLHTSAGEVKPTSFFGAGAVAAAVEAVADWAGMVLMTAVAAAATATRETQARFMDASWQGDGGRLTRLCQGSGVFCGGEHAVVSAAPTSTRPK